MALTGGNSPMILIIMMLGYDCVRPVLVRFPNRQLTLFSGMSRRNGYFVSGSLGRRRKGLRGDPGRIRDRLFYFSENLLPFPLCRRLDGRIIVPAQERESCN